MPRTWISILILILLVGGIFGGGYAVGYGFGQGNVTNQTTESADEDQPLTGAELVIEPTNGPANLFVDDGETAQQTPATLSNLEAGTYLLRLESPQVYTWRLEVEVEDGQVIVLRPQLVLRDEATDADVDQGLATEESPSATDQILSVVPAFDDDLAEWVASADGDTVQVSITFATALKTTSVKSSSVIVSDLDTDAVLSKELRFAEAQKQLNLLIDKADIDPSHTYQIRLLPGVSSIDGTTIEQELLIQFGADAEPIQIVETDDAAAAGNLLEELVDAVRKDATNNSVAASQRDLQRQADLNEVRTALELYYDDNLTYPQASGSETAVDLMEIRDDLAPTYIKTLPTDPLSSDPKTESLYLYTVSEGGEAFELSAELEDSAADGSKDYSVYSSN